MCDKSVNFSTLLTRVLKFTTCAIVTFLYKLWLFPCAALPYDIIHVRWVSRPKPGLRGQFPVPCKEADGCVRISPATVPPPGIFLGNKKAGNSNCSLSSRLSVIGLQKFSSKRLYNKHQAKSP